LEEKQKVYKIRSKAQIINVAENLLRQLCDSFKNGSKNEKDGDIISLHDELDSAGVKAA